MAYSEALAGRVREMLGERPDLTERKMFGGIAFMLGGNMCLGVIRDDLMVRVGPEAHEEALRHPGARPMDFAGRPMKGMVFVDESGYGQRDGLSRWVDTAVGFAASLPSKEAGSGVKTRQRRASQAKPRS